MKRKDKGTFTNPLLMMLMVVAIIFVIVFVNYNEGKHIVERTGDTVIISIQSAGLYDRYELATTDNESVSYYIGNATEHYGDNDEGNLELTKKACEYAYQLFIQVMESNLTTKYVIQTEQGMKEYVDSFKMCNVVGTRAYQYDLITGTASISAAVNNKSTISVKMSIALDLPLAGTQVFTYLATEKLEQRVH